MSDTRPEAGTPALNRHVPREEAQARIEAASQAASAALRKAKDGNRNIYEQLAEAKFGLERVSCILDGGK